MELDSEFQSKSFWVSIVELAGPVLTGEIAKLERLSQRIEAQLFFERKRVSTKPFRPNIVVAVDEFGPLLPILGRCLGRARQRYPSVQTKLQTDEDQAAENAKKPDYLQPIVQLS